MKVLIYNDNAKRDLLGLLILEKALRAHGLQTQICHPQNARIKLRQFRPHAFIAARGDSLLAREASSVCRIYIVPGEGGHQTKETMLSVFMGRGYWELNSVDWITRCYLWSNRTQTWLMDTGMFKAEQLLVVGSPRLDIYRDGNLAKALGRESKHFKLGVAFSAKSTSTYYGRPEFAKTYHDMHSELNFPITQPGRHFEDIVWRDHAILRNIMRVIRSYLEQSDGEVWLRPSPFESPKDYLFLEKRYNNRVRIVSSQTLPEFLYGVDAILTCWSTVGLEGLLLDKPVISISNLIDQAHLFQHISPAASGFDTFVRFYHQPNTERMLLETIDRASKGLLASSPRPRSEVLKLLDFLYAWPGDRSASELIAQDIARDLRTTPEKSPGIWKSHLPLPYELPLPIASLAASVRKFIITLQSGEFKAYLDFLRTSDPSISKLFRQMAASKSKGEIQS